MLAVHTVEFIFHSHHNPIKVSGWQGELCSVKSTRDLDFHLVTFAASAMVQGGQGRGEWGEGSSGLNCLDPEVKLYLSSNSIGENWPHVKGEWTKQVSVVFRKRNGSLVSIHGSAEISLSLWSKRLGLFLIYHWYSRMLVEQVHKWMNAFLRQKMRRK